MVSQMITNFNLLLNHFPLILIRIKTHKSARDAYPSNINLTSIHCITIIYLWLRCAGHIHIFSRTYLSFSIGQLIVKLEI